MNKIFNRKIVVLRATTVLLFSFICIATQGQILSTDEKIEVLGLGGQSNDIINFAAVADYSLEELEQANELRKLGVNDKNIILVLKTYAKLTYDEMLKLKEYQTKGYSETIIQKSVDEKPKFSIPQPKAQIEVVEDKYKEPTKGESKFRLPVDPETKKITFEETVDISGMKAEEISAKAQKWMKKYLAPKESIDVITTSDFNAKAKLELDKKFIPNNGQWMIDPYINFKVSFKCRDGQYKFKFTDYIHSYIRGSGDTYLVKPLEELEMVLVGLIHEEINRDMIKLIKELKTSIKPTNNDW